MQVIQAIINAIATPFRTLVSWFMYLLPGTQAFGRVSLPIRWAAISFLFLLIIYSAAAIKHLYFGQNDGGINWRILLLMASPFVIVIPVLVYYFVFYWLKEEQSPYPELDRIWNDGLTEAQSNGIHLRETPVFLVLGISNASETENFVSAAKQDFVVGLKGTDRAISFFASPKGIFVFANGCNCLSRLSAAKTEDVSRVVPTAADSDDDSEPGGTMDAREFARINDVSGTMTHMEGEESMAPGGTMLLDADQDFSNLVVYTQSSKKISSDDIADCAARLTYLCHLIKKGRKNLCPINGIITTIPIELIEYSSGQVQVAVQKDLSLLRRELLLRCPNTLLITGLEREDGFLDLTKRIPKDKLSANRFGKGAELWAPPEASRLDAIGVHAAGVFEDWVYRFFQTPDSLGSKDNHSLFRLVCRMRGGFVENLRTVLARGFGFDANLEPELAREQFLFGGCYFGAIGNSVSSQVFVKSVIDKAIQQDGELEWAPQARANDNSYQFLANLAAIFCIATIVFIATITVLHFRS